MPKASQTARRVATIDTRPLEAASVAAVEAAEAWAWADMFAAAPRGFAAAAGLSARWVAGALVISWAATGRRYFSRAIGLGVAEPATESDIDDVLDGFRAAGITMFLLQSLPACRPAAFAAWLADRGLEPFDSQDRIVRGAAPATGWEGPRDRDLVVSRVGPGNAGDWSDALQRIYRLDTGDWLPALVDRPRWHQYVVREEGAIVAARGMCLTPGGLAWLGMDGPVPGVMTDDHAPDAALCAAMVRDGLALGARGFVADIEAPSDDLDTPAYGIFSALGFRRPYTRTHWAVR